jgi:hypothetical protein
MQSIEETFTLKWVNVFLVHPPLAGGTEKRYREAPKDAFVAR